MLPIQTTIRRANSMVSGENSNMMSSSTTTTTFPSTYKDEGTYAIIMEGDNDSLYQQQQQQQQQQQCSNEKALLDDVLLALQAPAVQVVLSFFVLLSVPAVLFDGYSGDSLSDIMHTFSVVWDSLLHVSCWLLMSVTLLVSLYCGYRLHHQETQEVKNSSNHCININPDDGDSSSDDDDSLSMLSYPSSQPYLFSNYCGGVIVLILIVNVCVTCQLQMSLPSWIWSPYLFINGYHVYTPDSNAQSLKQNGLCLDYSFEESGDRDALCLPESSWDELSSGTLSGKNDNDVAAVLKGIDYIKQTSNGRGLVLNVMCRDCYDQIPALRKNVENLRHFFPSLILTVFENDSMDGSREAFQRWEQEVNSNISSNGKGYTVDLMECEEAPGCKFGESHRYDATEATNYYYSSAIGKMAQFRQRMIDHILSHPMYDNYSHMVVYDMDLSISISPLGILHSIGELPDNPVASSGRQPLPATLGTITPPYDFSAFRSHPTKRNARLRHLHEMYCNIMPAGHRWHNMCDALGSAHNIQVLDLDRGQKDIYRVASAFNGAVLYPLSIMRRLKSSNTPNTVKYDKGVDGQRCEHIGFHMSLQTPMFVNRKWNFNLDPKRPGGPTGKRAIKVTGMITFTPQLGLFMFILHIISYVLYVFATMRIGMLLFYPMFFKSLFVKRLRLMGVLPLIIPSQQQHQINKLTRSKSSLLKV